MKRATASTCAVSASAARARRTTFEFQEGGGLGTRHDDLDGRAACTCARGSTRRACVMRSYPFRQRQPCPPGRGRRVPRTPARPRTSPPWRSSRTDPRAGPPARVAAGRVGSVRHRFAIQAHQSVAGGGGFGGFRGLTRGVELFLQTHTHTHRGEPRSHPHPVFGSKLRTHHERGPHRVERARCCERTRALVGGYPPGPTEAIARYLRCCARRPGVHLRWPQRTWRSPS